MQHPVIRQLNDVLSRDVAARNLLEGAHVESFEIHDHRLLVDRADGIDRTAVILVLGQDRNFNSVQTEDVGIVDLLIELVERVLPLGVQKISVEKVVVCLH